MGLRKMCLFEDLSQSKNLVSTTGPETGLIITHTPFASTR